MQPGVTCLLLKVPEQLLALHLGVAPLIVRKPRTQLGHRGHKATLLSRS